jgi:leader peptidase (prepilin peptidase) / N-methyltransferase
MNILISIIFAAFGAVIGSFLNVIADRLPDGKSIVYPASHCPACGHHLAPKDLFPVASYVLLRGRCRYCRAKIPVRVVIIEAATALIFALSFLIYGLTFETAVTIFYFSLFLLLMVIDLEHTIIPNKIVYPTAVVALAISAFTPKIGIVSALIGGAAGLLIFLVIAIVSRGGMGLGDVKMAALIGFATGFPLVLVGLLMSVIMGGVIAILLLVLRIRKLKEGIPFAPYLSLGTMATLLWGQEILNWYIKLYM